ncbi:MAG TPA: hypothetical protein VIM12_09800 [Noviherbaspirillum sp.]|jgi:hypothetical protein|uniref:hypothetical protein n=1 Tax=Noviherbaspirillum sp. TaxID=1926288 RepID=UPI002F956CF3
MHRLRTHRRLADCALAALLLLALLAAQWTGWQHRIAHAGFERAQVAAHAFAAIGTPDAAPDDTLAHGDHSCLLLDAAALGTGLHAAIVSLPPAPAAARAGDMEQRPSWRPRFLAHFSPRAPPFA